MMLPVFIIEFNLMKLNVLLLSFSFSRGGAGVAAQKFARIANGFSRVHCYCAEPSRVDDLCIENPSRLEFCIHFIKRLISYFLNWLMYDGNPIKHSLNLFSSKAALRVFNRVDECGGVLHLHWFNNDTISLWDLDRLPSVSVITLHDEWLYCGSEHCCSVTGPDERFIYGYNSYGDGTRGIDWNRWAWRKKYEKLKNRNDLIFTVPSSWMLERAKVSLMLKNKDIRLLPNPIDVGFFCPLSDVDRRRLRNNINVSKQDILIAFGAVKWEKNFLKGGDLLREALREINTLYTDKIESKVKILLFGDDKLRPEMYGEFPAISLGRVDGGQGMREVYNMADVVVVPSMVEAFGQVAAESLACETPVVAFRCSGLIDIVQESISGFLAEPYDVSALAKCLMKIIEMSATDRLMLGKKGRNHVRKNFSFDVVARSYETILFDAFRKKHATSKLFSQQL